VGLALVTRIPNLMEAQIAAGALRASGIHAQVFDGTFGGMEAPVIEGLGGYRLMAPESEVAEAREMLKALRANPPPRDPDDRPWAEPAATSSRFRSTGMRVVALLFLAAPFILMLILRLFRPQP
jgi:hypothetical protein